MQWHHILKNTSFKHLYPCAIMYIRLANWQRMCDLARNFQIFGKIDQTEHVSNMLFIMFCFKKHIVLRV